MKTSYRLLMGGTALLVSLFLNFRYAYGGYGASAQFSSDPSLRSAVPDKNPNPGDDSDTDTGCGTAPNGEPYICASKIKYEHSVGSCIFYVAEYEYSEKKAYDIKHEGEYDVKTKKFIEVKPDDEYDDWKVNYTLRNADISKVYPEYLPPGVCNKEDKLPRIKTEYVAGTKTDITCLEGGLDKCLPKEGKPTCAGESDSNFGY